MHGGCNYLISNASNKQVGEITIRTLDGWKTGQEPVHQRIDKGKVIYEVSGRDHELGIETDDKGRQRQKDCLYMGIIAKDDGKVTMGRWQFTMVLDDDMVNGTINIHQNVNGHGTITGNSDPVYHVKLNKRGPLRRMDRNGKFRRSMGAAWWPPTSRQTKGGTASRQYERPGIGCGPRPSG
jgi:hypothetical protein